MQTIGATAFGRAANFKEATATTCSGGGLLPHAAPAAVLLCCPGPCPFDCIVDDEEADSEGGHDQELAPEEGVGQPSG